MISAILVWIITISIGRITTEHRDPQTKFDWRRTKWFGPFRFLNQQKFEEIRTHLGPRLTKNEKSRIEQKFEIVGPNKDQQIFENKVVRRSLTEHVHVDKVTRFTMTIIPTTNPALFSMNCTFQKLLNYIKTDKEIIWWPDNVRKLVKMSKNDLDSKKSEN